VIIDSAAVVEVFSQLNSFQRPYILLRNIDNELPDNLKYGKDIDILINKSDEASFKEFFKKIGYNPIKHPLANNVFLYGVDRFEYMYANKNNHILIDPCFQLVCRSLNAGEWIPLDQIIQESAWHNRRFVEQNNNLSYWSLSYDDEFITLIARSIFDKRTFAQGYIKRIEEIYSLISLDNVNKKMNLIFFKFTPLLLQLIENREYSDLVDRYIKFKDY